MARADALFNVAGMHVLDVAHDEAGRLVVTMGLTPTWADAARAGW